MTEHPTSIHDEGLKVARLLMVLSSMSPLFILWAIRGNGLISDFKFIVFCIFMVIIPNFFLWFRIRTAKRQSDKREIIVGTADDHRDHILVYLFTMLLPFYSIDIETWRDLSATFAALIFIIFLFWYMNFHYMNLLFAIRGYRIFTICPPADDNMLTGTTCYALITHRMSLVPGDRVIAYRLSNTVYLEVEK